MNTHRWPRWPLALLLLLSVVLSTQVGVPRTAFAATDGVVTGTVTNGTTGAAMPGITVVLSRYDDPTSLESVDTEAVTGDDGTFRFDEVDTSDGLAHVVYVEHLGVSYNSGMLLLYNTPDPTANVTVYETTTDPSVVTASSRALVLSGIDADLGVMTVTDITTFDVSGERTYIGQEANRTATFTVPENALQVSPRGGFNFGSPLVERNVVFSTGPMLPGESTAIIDYQVPYTGTSHSFELHADLPIDAVQLLIPEDLAGGELGFEGPSDLLGGQQISAGELTYRAWVISSLERDESLDLTVTGLPRPAVAQRTLRTWTPLLVALGVAACAVALTVYGMRSRRLVAATPETTQATLLRAERERIADELRSLEAAWQAGDVEEERYRDERLVILQELRDAARLERQHSGETRRA